MYLNGWETITEVDGEPLFRKCRKIPMKIFHGSTHCRKRRSSMVNNGIYCNQSCQQTFVRSYTFLCFRFGYSFLGTNDREMHVSYIIEPRISSTTIKFNLAAYFTYLSNYSDSGSCRGLGQHSSNRSIEFEKKHAFCRNVWTCLCLMFAKSTLYLASERAIDYISHT